MQGFGDSGRRSPHRSYSTSVLHGEHACFLPLRRLPRHRPELDWRGTVLRRASSSRTSHHHARASQLQPPQAHHPQRQAPAAGSRSPGDADSGRAVPEPTPVLTARQPQRTGPDNKGAPGPVGTRRPVESAGCWSPTALWSWHRRRRTCNPCPCANNGRLSEGLMRAGNPGGLEQNRDQPLHQKPPGRARGS